VVGDGPFDLVLLGYGNVISIDARDSEPHVHRFERRLASFSRLVRFDPRGVGLSDPIVDAAAWGVSQSVEDLIAVLDAVRSERAVFCAAGSSGCTAMLAAATYPERISALVLIHGSARRVWAEDYPFGVPRRGIDAFLDSVLDVSGSTDGSVDDAGLMAPSLAGDPEYRAWWRRAGQRGASPSSARAVLTASLLADVRGALPSISAPTLVLHRVGHPFLPMEHGRYLAGHIAGARLVQLSGEDPMPYAGDMDAVIEEIEEFLTGERGASDTDRVLTTLLFTDIVASTEHASRAGDQTWRELLDRHDSMVRAELRRFGGREVKSTGDGILATFASPARAMRCAQAIHDGARRIGVEIRAGLHTGEVQMRGDDVSGIAVHIAQRVSARAGAGEVLVSRTMVDLVAGSGIEFEDRGEHELKGVQGRWRLFAVQSHTTLNNVSP
jgi:class 3 adenylate cyclase